MAPVPSAPYTHYVDGDNVSIGTQFTAVSLGSFSTTSRKSNKRSQALNIMVVGEPGIGKTTLLSSLFEANLEVPKTTAACNLNDNPTVEVNTKSFEMEKGGVRIKLTISDCQNYGLALELKNTHKPIVDYIEQQLAHYHQRELGVNRRDIQDTMVHCLFFFISALRPARLSELDIAFLKAVHEKVNVVPIIAMSDALTKNARDAFKLKLRNEFEKHSIQIYEIPAPDPDDPDDYKREILELINAMPFAISSLSRKRDGSFEPRVYKYGALHLTNREHSDYPLLKKMLELSIPDLREKTRDCFYEEYRIRMIRKE